MEINQLADQLYNNKPKPACTQQISIYEGNSINEQFEIITLLTIEGINRKIMNNINKEEDKKKYIQKMLILVKIYMASIGIKLNIEYLTKKDIKNIKLTRSLNFWVIKSYPFELNCFYKYIKKGKEQHLYYNPKSKVNNFQDCYVIIQIYNVILKLSYKTY